MDLDVAPPESLGAERAPTTTRSRRRSVPPNQRPRPPHDWRWVVGGIGKTLIATGLLVFAFVGYQLWGTGIQYAQAQAGLEDEFEALLASAGTIEAPTTTTAPSPVTTVDDTLGEPAGTTAPVVTSTAVDPTLELIELGGAIGRMEIPKIGMSGVIVAGVRVEDLRSGVGHYPDTPLPGQLGNSAIAGHRTTYGAPFFDIAELVNGDEIRITTLQGEFLYRVTGQRIVAPTEYSVVADTPGRATLTITSCNPKFSARERIVITAELDVTGSDEVREPVVFYGRDAPLPTGTDQGTDDDPSTVVPDESAVEGSTGGSTSDVTALGSEDAFARGWFSDDDAWPQVALWGLACTAVALAATFLGRRTRNWIGALVGFVPFVIVLYFFFQNVNRLLPPGL